MASDQTEMAPTSEHVRKFKLVYPMLASALREMREFAKKKQDGIVSATKIKLVNRLLSDARDALEREDSSAYLDLISEEELPQTSDVVLVLGQYQAALDRFKERHHRQFGFEVGRRWATEEALEEHRERAKEMDEDEEEYEDED